MNTHVYNIRLENLENLVILNIKLKKEGGLNRPPYY